MNNSGYVSDLLVALSNAANSGCISPTEEKQLADNVMDNKERDIFSARLIEKTWDVQDGLEGINYYGN